MKIIILGAGQVGGTLATNLASEDNDITVVDTVYKKLARLLEHLDIRTVNGHCSHPDVLAEAGAEDADLLIAVTNSDEVNMIACQLAWSIFRIQTKIARVRSQNYLENSDIFRNQIIPIDVVISPEQLVTEYIQRLIQYPGALQVVDFAHGRVRLVAVKAYYGGPLVGNALSALKVHMPTIETRVAAIFRQGKSIIPSGDTIIEADDEVFFIAATKYIKNVMSELQRLETPYKRIIIAGGGHIGFGLAKALEESKNVTIIERSPERAQEICKHLNHAVVIQEDVSDQDIMIQENIDEVDLFIAVTNNDEANIMSAMLAKRLGAAKTMVLINRSAYVDLLQGHEIDIAISPQQTTISSLLTHIRRGDIANVHSLRRGVAEAIETVAHGDEYKSKVVGHPIQDIKLPPGTTIGAIVRGEQVLMAHDNVVIRENDHVILFMVDKKYAHDVERIFQVDVTFF